MILETILFIVGLIALVYGAKLLVSGASNIAKALHISPLLIGLTVVAFGTGAPEIAVCTLGAWRGEGALVLGNLVGSNIFNVLLVLGICATLSPLVIKRRLIWWDVPLMIFISLVFWAMASFGTITRLFGAILFAGVIAYLIIAYKLEKKEPKPHEPQPKEPQETHKLYAQFIWIILALVLLGFGSDLLIKSATKIAHFFQISELLIGLTLVAVGTSLPEIATSIVALVKKEHDLAVGNIIGSNIFNLLAAMGIAALIAPNGVQVPHQAIVFDLPIMVAVALACLPIFLTGHKIARWEGILFLFYYALYLTFLILQTYSSDLLPLFTTAFIFFILPLTLLTLGVGVVRHFQKR